MKKKLIIIIPIVGIILIGIGLIITFNKSDDKTSKPIDTSKDLICKRSENEYSIVLTVHLSKYTIESYDAVEEWKYKSLEDFKAKKESISNDDKKYVIDENKMTIKLSSPNQRLIDVDGNEHQIFIADFVASLEDAGYNCK